MGLLVSSLVVVMMLVPLPGRIGELTVDAAAAQQSADASQPSESRKTPDAPKKCFAILFATGPAFSLENGMEGLPGISAHFEFVTSMHAKGIVPLAGPLFQDEEMTQVTGALYLVFADNLKEARAIAMQEPLFQEKVVVISSISLFLAGVGTLD